MLHMMQFNVSCKATVLGLHVKKQVSTKAREQGSIKPALPSAVI